jgi:hypothetical protein
MEQDQDLKSLDKLIAGIGGAESGTQSMGPCGLLLEHLQTARRSLLGSMGDEYSLSLQQAKEFVGCIVDKDARTRTHTALEGLIASRRPRG